ncbi:alpha/beta hydrolase [Amycolatopsis antarctica]|uniref:Acyl-CoA:diacylglycerol acyltransferase n=1 Tax=Amycolatopsis antarctica TaxID=1854586 RepID=A0A263D803_9PSEU|nr:alpha/beta hydrolase-fold protein [Amycolatopsis antarctica]OZM74610.1 alpha/beta hydrolase [Amycolatopsis antarctica]
MPAQGERRHSRRSVLLAGGSGLGVLGVAAATASGKLPFTEPLQRGLGVASPSPATQVGVTRIEKVYSAARGREVELVTMLPSRSPARGLPMVLLLHGLGASARKAAPTGLVSRLSSDVARRAMPSFGFVAVDGGNSYWHENTSGDDPMGMLLEEIPAWLRERGLGGRDGAPFACAGNSMGGFGSMLYARRRSERRQPVSAVAVMAPALITSWAEMSKRGAFRDAADWASMDPLRNIDALRGIPTGLWCGTEDRFIEGARRYIAAARPTVGFTGPGTHSDAFNRSVVPSVIGFLGKHVPRSGAASVR